MAFITALNLVLARVMFSLHCGIPDQAAQLPDGHALLVTKSKLRSSHDW